MKCALGFESYLKKLRQNASYGARFWGKKTQAERFLWGAFLGQKKLRQNASYGARF